tara:strand:+ start:255 stop:461 length:207 start_codon:yes stop_codon:yes gene_type:complete
MINKYCVQENKEMILEKGGMMEVKIEKAREILRQLELANGGSRIAKARRMCVIHEMLAKTRETLEIHY